MQTDDIRVQDDLMDYFDLHALQDKLDRELPADYQHYIDHLPGATMFDIPAEPAHQDRKDMFLASLVQSNASKLLPLAHEQPQFRFEIQHLPPSGVAALDFQEGSPLELLKQITVKKKKKKKKKKRKGDDGDEEGKRRKKKKRKRSQQQENPAQYEDELIDIG